MRQGRVRVFGVAERGGSGENLRRLLEKIRAASRDRQGAVPRRSTTSPGQTTGQHQPVAINYMTVDRGSILRTYPLIRPYIRRTPIIEVDGADFGLDGVRLVLKLELLQHSGSFKARGAFTNLLLRDVPPAGVVAASGGNHGAAVAFAAMRLGKPARIFVPTVASPAKMERIRGYGAELVVTGERYADALAASEEWVAQSGAMPVHAYEQVETLVGQGTVGLEFEEQDPAVDCVLVAVGGGGLIGGIAVWDGRRPEIVRGGPELGPTLHID